MPRTNRCPEPSRRNVRFGYEKTPHVRLNLRFCCDAARTLTRCSANGTSIRGKRKRRLETGTRTTCEWPKFGTVFNEKSASWTAGKRKREGRNEPSFFSRMVWGRPRNNRETRAAFRADGCPPARRTRTRGSIPAPGRWNRRGLLTSASCYGRTRLQQIRQRVEG